MTETIFQTESVRRSRTIERLVFGQATTDGAGVNLIRVLTQPLQQRLDPFLMLDAFGSDDPDDYIAGFPDHPHRGFETVTYMIAGRMLQTGTRFEQALPIERNAFIYVYRGAVGIAGQSVPSQRMAILANAADADGVAIEAVDEARVLLIAGQPLREPIVQHGPFVMNTMQEIQHAVRDYSAGRLA